ncbi:hypothetical protein CFE70_004709 [Pyrenophora teres f. teres 0-1]|uniref:Uncharacterized protein n=2 Tax=Pyrenophora teres f. teres TaxID=97479 RepID=E3RLP2_PYRTT|nr:hypothetical protein PTT_09300 [Pyrenophora teres f. teres 0-1]KAE8833657.1 hypothetical protein HRS9139_05476 [Pyrenophora teres f. teres]KAE8840573.1 hypothetical protein PTNB85_03972 [Pyrenophora teres f. teres]KAE8849285.1 hypothetical protein HRS9122_03301 [Pyrenophora teres f. teres]KAE8864070.1 hypothetical protein PTNB29_04034 [Pyrenophora teres f. teres]
MNNYSFLESAQQQQAQQQQQQQHNQQRPPPSPSHSQAGSIAASQNGGGQNGVPMVNGLPSGGQQTDMNHLWAVVQQLSQLLEENKAQTRGIVEGVAAIQGRAALEEGGEVGGASMRGGGGPAMSQVNGEIHAATQAHLQSQLSAAQSTIASLTSTNSSLSTLLTDYESALTILLDKLRPYAYSQTNAILALHKHYQTLLDQERSTSMALRLEHAEWQAGLSRVAENARNALRMQGEVEAGLRGTCKELAEENRVLRLMVGWEEREQSDDEEEMAKIG